MKNRIAYIRNLRGLTQGDLANTLGVEQETISRYERGARPITLDKLVVLAQLLKCHPGDLIEWGDDGQSLGYGRLDVDLLRKYIVAALKHAGGPIPNEILADMAIRGYLERLALDEFDARVNFVRPANEIAKIR